ncbi:hypothetical protein AAMO2058_001183200 [Amorphochlora amoebiformis]
MCTKRGFVHGIWITGLVLFISSHYVPRKSKSKFVDSISPNLNLWSKPSIIPESLSRDAQEGNHTRTVAMLYSGFVRSFRDERVRETHVKHLIEPFKNQGFKVHIFYVMGAADRQPGARAGFNETILPKMVKGWISEEFGVDYVRVESKEPPKAETTYTKCQDWNITSIHHLDQIPRFWGTWWRVRTVYRMALEYEKARGDGWRYDVMLRIRPDFVFVKSTNLSRFVKTIENPLTYGSNHSYPATILTSNLNPSGKFVIVPANLMLSGRQRMNDWAVACPRDSCHDYFEMISLWERCVDNICCWGWGPFYNRALAHNGVDLWDSFHLFPVTLVRKKGVACHRFKEYLGYDSTLLEKCYSFAKKIGKNALYTCKINGKLVISRRC